MFDSFVASVVRNSVELWLILPTGPDDEFGWVGEGPDAVTYYISSEGRVFWCAPRAPLGKKAGLKALRLDRKKGKQPHLKVNLAEGRKRYRTVRVHRLVMAAFSAWVEQRGGSLVRHLNGNGCDNRIWNLCRGTHSENLHDQYRLGERRATKAEFDDSGTVYSPHPWVPF